MGLASPVGETPVVSQQFSLKFLGLVNLLMSTSVDTQQTSISSRHANQDEVQ